MVRYGGGIRAGSRRIQQEGPQQAWAGKVTQGSLRGGSVLGCQVLSHSLVVLVSRSYSGVRNPSEVPMNRRMGRNADLHIPVSVRRLEGHRGTHHPGTPG